ncbi:hypothetical protein ACE02Y_14200, partial [Shewanella xiamenensis]
MGELMGYVDQITSYGFSSTDLGNKAPACIGFNVMIDALSSHLKEGGSLFNINDLPAAGDTGSYAQTGFTKRSDAWDNYLRLADVLYKQMRADGVINEHALPAQ